jgi:hypothetical protein
MRSDVTIRLLKDISGWAREGLRKGLVLPARTVGSGTARWHVETPKGKVVGIFLHEAEIVTEGTDG